MCIRDRVIVGMVAHDVQHPALRLACVVQIGEGIAEAGGKAVSYTHLRAHETVLDLVCRLLLEKKKNDTILNEQLISE